MVIKGTTLIEQLQKLELKVDKAIIKDGHFAIGGKTLEGAKEHLQKLVSYKTYLQETRTKADEEYKKGKSGVIWEQKNQLYFLIARLNNPISQQKNLVKALSNGGGFRSIKDQYGHTWQVPSFVGVDTSEIIFEPETILTDEAPVYVPFINLETLNRRAFVLDAITITENEYLVSIDSYEYDSDEPNFMVVLSLDQLVLTSDYYISKQRAINIDEANKRNARAIEAWHQKPLEQKARYLKYVKYRDLRAKDRKTITEGEFNLLSMEEKAKRFPWVQLKNPKRIKTDDSFWNDKGRKTMPTSFHIMFENFIDKTATRKKKGYQTYAHPKAWAEWDKIKYLLKFKIIDIKEQRKELSDSRKAGMETSYGHSHTNPLYLEDFGILVKRQNGESISSEHIAEIEEAYFKVQSLFGSLNNFNNKKTLVLSHSGKKYMYAAKAIGVFIPSFNAIGVSGKYGLNQFSDTMAHEIAHYIDHNLGAEKGYRYLTDDYSSQAFKVANTFRKNLNDKGIDSDYLLSTKECFARAMQQHFAISTRGFDAEGVYDFSPPSEGKPYIISSAFVSKKVYEDQIKPEIAKLLKEYATQLPKFNGAIPEGTTEERLNKIKVGDKIKKGTIEGIVYEVTPSGKTFRLKDEWGNKDTKYFISSEFENYIVSKPSTKKPKRTAQNIKNEMTTQLERAKRINEGRSKAGRKRDKANAAKVQRLPTKKNVDTWAKNPGKSDIIGVDGPANAKPTLKRDKSILEIIIGI